MKYATVKRLEKQKDNPDSEMNEMIGDYNDGLMKGEREHDQNDEWGPGPTEWIQVAAQWEWIFGCGPRSPPCERGGWMVDQLFGVHRLKLQRMAECWA